MYVTYLLVLFQGRGTGGRGNQVGMRIQRRVRMGMKGELSSPYILSPSQITWLFTCIYLVPYIPFLVHNLIFVCCWNLLECSGSQGKGFDETKQHDGRVDFAIFPHQFAFPLPFPSHTPLLLCLQLKPLAFPLLPAVPPWWMSIGEFVVLGPRGWMSLLW